MFNLLTVETRPVPLDRLPNGVFRVAGTRIGLDIVIRAYKHGLAPEQIVEDYDSLRLADVYALIAFYLDHTAEVEQYLRDDDALALEVRRKIEAAQPPRPWMKEKLLRRKAERERSDVPAGE